MHSSEPNSLNLSGKPFLRGIGILRKLSIMFFKEALGGERVRKFEIFVTTVTARSASIIRRSNEAQFWRFYH